MRLKKIKKKIEKLNSRDLHELDTFITHIFILKIREDLDRTKGRFGGDKKNG